MHASFGKHGMNGILETAQAAAASDENVLHAPCLNLPQDVCPKLGTLSAIAHPVPKHILAPLQIDCQNDIESGVFNPSFALELHINSQLLLDPLYTRHFYFCLRLLFFLLGHDFSLLFLFYHV